ARLRGQDQPGVGRARGRRLRDLVATRRRARPPVFRAGGLARSRAGRGGRGVPARVPPAARRRAACAATAPAVIEFRPLAEEDLPLIERWLGEEHVARWWREPVAKEIAEFRAGIEGRDPTDHYLVVLDGRPVGMVQTYLASDYPEWEEEIGELGSGA